MISFTDSELEFMDSLISSQDDDNISKEGHQNGSDYNYL